jgi:hypothetical protein
MGIITKEVEIRLNGNNVNYYKKLGYDIPVKKAGKSTKYLGLDYVADFHKSILVKIEDLPLNSKAIVETTCDYCGELKPLMKYADYNKQTKNGTLKCCCEKCAPLKHKEIMLERYGHEGTMQVPQIREKVFMTNLQKYGYEHPSQSLEIREKIAKTFYANSSQKASKQQRYINNLYQGTLNFPVKFYCADIYLPCDNLVVEFNGSGHMLNVIMGHETMEEYLRKETIRSIVIKNEGYKQMQIISSNDKLPSDRILLQMLSETKQYFSRYPNHSWIEYDIDNSIVRNAEFKNGTPYNYGALRKIKDSDLHEFVA